MERDSFVFYRSFYQAIKKLDDKALADTVKGICSYALDGELPTLEGIAEIIFEMAKPQIDANNKRLIDGRKGGRPKKTSGFEIENHRFSEKKPNVNVNANVNANANVNVNANENVNEKNRDKPQHVFIPPSIDEVKNYCWERKNNIDAQAFIDFYSSKGWMIGKNKMKDWKAAIRTWEQRNEHKQEKKSNGFFAVDDDFFMRKMEGL